MRPPGGETPFLEQRRTWVGGRGRKNFLSPGRRRHGTARPAGGRLRAATAGPRRTRSEARGGEAGARPKARGHERLARCEDATTRSSRSPPRRRAHRPIRWRRCPPGPEAPPRAVAPPANGLPSPVPSARSPRGAGSEREKRTQPVGAAAPDSPPPPPPPPPPGSGVLSQPESPVLRPGSGERAR